MNVATPSATSHAALRKLADERPGLRVSIYIPLLAHPGFDEIRAFPRTYEQAVRSAAGRMIALGFEPSKVQRMSEGLRSMDIQLAGLPRSARGLAVLLGPTGLRVHTLSTATEERVGVGRSFLVRPLLSAARIERGFRVIALSAGRVELFEGDAEGLRPIELPEVPASMEDALGSERTEPTLQMHSSASGGRMPIFHGQGGGQRALDRNRFHVGLIRALKSSWGDRDDPLVLVADESHQGRFRKLARLPGLLDAGVVANPSHLRAGELHERALAVVRERITAEDREGARAAVEALAHGAAQNNLRRAAAAAVAGRVARIWLDGKRRVETHIDATSGGLVEPLGDEDALDELAALVIARGGEALVGPENVFLDGSGFIAELRG